MAEIENLKIGNGTLHIVGNQDIVADSWEAGKTYVADRSYVIREHILYVCNTTHTSVEPFDPTKWTATTIGEALGSGTITNDNNLPHFSGTPTQGTTAEAIASKATNTDASPLFKTKSTGALSKSFNANAYSAFSANDIGLSITGYTPVSVLNADNNNANVILNGYNLSATGSATMFLYRNVSTSSQTASFTFTLLFARNDIVKAVT